MRFDKFPLAITSLLLITACTDQGSLPATQEPAAAHEHVSGVADGFWPPQPTETRNVEILPASALGGAQAAILDAARQTVMTNPGIRNLLGDNFRAFDGSLSDAKATETASFMFYNYSTDETIIARLQPQGAVEHQVLAAEEFQPPEHPEEVALATQLAQDALTVDGFDTDELIGTALLAFPPAMQINSQQQHFYPQRMLYVTFGPGNGALPVFSALINISTGTVVESGLVK